ncbi:GMC family oxidoreductase [Streptomyces radicis]|uniref:GMC family oxidoreductase n=1 Tax=Streptomyces radicis TaxID=1750517 RepID=A0A3A9WWC7_9ACTN|nr:GMC family oxidoreductase [Streptomyces radicis]RKN10477.1 GMC family oxidoreductase [Streptomyces radicis]RKN24736.1 GMC family oxidoreductase [Streptomyces radicis]
MAREDTLRAFVERVVPGGWAAGVGDFIAASGADLAPLTLLDGRHTAEEEDRLLADDPGLADLVRLCAQGYWGRPGQAWEAIGYRAAPEGDAPFAPDDTPPTLAVEDATGPYDAVVIGAGAGGGVVACVLAEAGQRVLLVERGPWLTAHDLAPDHLRNQRVIPGYTDRYDPPAGPPAEGNPRVSAGPGGDVTVTPGDSRWSNNAMTVGGGTRVYGAQAWRFCPEDFAMARTYGVPDGSSLADWPLTYDDLAPHYDRAEWEIGVSGDPDGNVHAGPRTRGYPMPPLAPNGTARPLAEGARRLGLRTSPVPLLINSVPRDGRGACVGCATCVGFGCRGDFKNDTRNTVIRRALATGRCDLMTGVQAGYLNADPRFPRITGVTLFAERGGEVVTRSVSASRFVLAAGAVETPRLLFNSRAEGEGAGIGNGHDQLGRHLQGHVYAGAFGLFDEDVQDCVGPGPSIATNDHRHHNDGIVGGGLLANDFVPTPLQTYATLARLGVIPATGAGARDGMRDLYRRLALVTGPIQEIPNPAARVTVDRATRDRFGIPVARLGGTTHPEDARTAAFLADRAAEWLAASGARAVFPHGAPPIGVPSGGQHQAGTCRMGEDPATSVTDPWGRVWSMRNVWVADASLHVTNGGVNPVLTILALAHRVAEAVARA